MSDVETTHGTGRPSADGRAGGHDPVPAVVDWALGALVAAAGVVATSIGVGLYTRVDRAAITDAVYAEGTEVNGLTRAEAVTAGVPFVDWVAVGVVLTGLLTVAGAVAFVVARRRTRREVARDGGTTATFPACAVYGAAVTVLVSFVPASAIAGGGAAAHLRDRGSGLRVGAATGLVGAAPTLPMVAFLGVGIAAGGAAIGDLAGGVLLAAVVLAAQVVGVAINAGLGALGGYLVTRFA